ncbi:MAG: winged helix-turn-helix transcriptional regulator [Anaerolineales bacterium]
MALDETQETRELILLEEIEEDPDITQANLAEKLGVAVGTVNWHLKRLISKGYVKAKRAQRKKLRYIITPEGLALRAKLTVKYVENQMRLYRTTRQHVKEFLEEVQVSGYSAVKIEGDSEIADVCQLTCLEQGFEVVEKGDVPVLSVQGYEVFLEIPQDNNGVRKTSVSG